MPKAARLVPSTHKLYYAYTSMLARCYRDKRCAKYYPQRGITVCQEWLDDRDKFFAWALENGYYEGAHMDRIDNSRGYSPDNCRWTTSTVNNRNRTSSKLTYADACVIKDMCLRTPHRRSGMTKLMAALFGVNMSTIVEIKRGDIWKNVDHLAPDFYERATLV